MRNNGTELFLSTTTKINSKWITDPKTSAKTGKLRRKLVNNPCNSGLSKALFVRILKTQMTTGNT